MMILPEGGNLDVTVYPGGQADSGDLAVKRLRQLRRHKNSGREKQPGRKQW